MLNEIKWTIDQPHSEISFKIKHLMIAHVKGQFKIFDAIIHTMGKDFTTAKIDLWIDVDSINTGDEKREHHLKSPDFFDVEKYKQITFTSSNIEKPGAKGDYKLTGELTMKGVTKTILLNVRLGGIVDDPWGSERAGFSVTGKLKKSDWGLVWNTAIETGGFLLGDEVSITCEIELINAGPKDPKMDSAPTTAERNII